MTSILHTITDRKKQEVEEAKRHRPLSMLTDHIESPVRNFIQPLKDNNPAIIAEIKKASPSKGVIRENFDVASIAKSYEQSGASCLSVLTDIDFFKGHPENLNLAKEVVTLPCLRKDFIIDAYQVDESRAIGADCILLIAAILDNHQMLDFCQHAQALGMAVLVESHTQAELDRALNLPTPLMGINNRDLHGFKTDINQSIMLSKMIPSDRIIISESGIHSHQDIKYLQSHDISTFLIGEQLMRADDPGKALTQLIKG
jgi:indole-3-glycerol phosphate synthase